MKILGFLKDKQKRTNLIIWFLIAAIGIVVIWGFKHGSNPLHKAFSIIQDTLFNRSGPDPLEHQAAGAGNPAVSDASGGRCAAGGPGSWPRGAEYPLRDGVPVSDQ